MLADRQALKIYSGRRRAKILQCHNSSRSNVAYALEKSSCHGVAFSECAVAQREFHISLLAESILKNKRISVSRAACSLAFVLAVTDLLEKKPCTFPLSGKKYARIKRVELNESQQKRLDYITDVARVIVGLAVEHHDLWAVKLWEGLE